MHADCVPGQPFANHLSMLSRGANGRQEIVMRTALHVSRETLLALINIGSFAVVVGAAAAIYTQSLRTGLLLLGTFFISAALGFLYCLWRFYRPRSHERFDWVA